MKLRNLVGLLALSLAIPAAAQPPTAQSAIAAGLKAAAAQHKNVLVDFGASWCPWCVKFEELLADPTFGPKFKASFVLVSVRVREVKPHEAEENPGWEQAMASFRPTKDQDIPYLVILNSRGAKLGDSYEPNGRIPNNAGFPQTPKEIDEFIALMRKTAKGFSAADLKALKAHFANARGGL